MTTARQVPDGGRRGGRGERGNPAGEANKTFDGPPTPPRPDAPPPIAAPLLEPPPQPEPDRPPSVLYLIIAALVLLAAWLAWYTYKLRLRLTASGTSDASVSGPSLFVSPSDAQAGAIKGLKEYGLDKRDKWKPYLMWQGVLVTPLEPVLVQQIDTPDLGEAFYYLVPLGRDLASVRAVACVDGVTGEYQECSRFEGGHPRSWGQMMASWLTAARTRASIVEGKIDLHLPAGTEVRKAAIGVHPHLVWKASVESESVFWPFRLVKLGDTVRYIRIDGTVFDKLT